MRLYAFFAGYEIADKSMLTLGRGLGVQVKIPFQFFLVEHPKARFLFDTGMNPAALSDPAHYPPTAQFGSYVTEADLAVNRLAEVALKPDDIELVINSHLHYDHAGGNCQFPQATFMVQYDEMQSAMCPEPWSGLVAENYARVDFDLPVRYDLLDGDYDVFGDGSARLIRTPGHTRGHQSLVLRLPNTGTMILAQDAVYLLENFERHILATTCFDQKAMYFSYRRLQDIQRLENALILPGHDIQAWEKLRHAPAYYD
ncbi:MAG: N-acyl homoserine lactonase family protein [Chloroflexi bacterium]|nr:N-acyl homoserine lactonase family protein [Chloroflexota bacterium]